MATKNDLVYYKAEVKWPEPTGTFILAFDKKNNKVLYYSNNYKLEAECDLNDPNSKIPGLLHFSHSAIATSILIIYRALRDNDFSNTMSHESCANNVFMRKIEPDINI